ncbi:MAG: hypothetical protein IJT73_03500 [Selenomonadaceae bacterium]|nr:hypothetical protein [Selenomonadaceae bacterium]
MKKFLAGILAAAILFFPSISFAVPEFTIPEEVYKWIQSTPRGNYYFNYQVCGYKINDDDTLDLNILEVPTIITYDNIQIEDVIQKRKWRGKSTRGYNNLIGRADYLVFNFADDTVQIERRADLDHTFTELDSYDAGEPMKLAEFSPKDVSSTFYREILEWVQKNNDWVIRRSRGKLSAKDAKLNPADFPIFKVTMPGN